MTTGPSNDKFAGTRFGVALLLVLFVNVVLANALPTLKVSAADLPSAHTWEWWRTRSFMKTDPAPDVVLLGSSLMMIPVSVLDADYLHKDLDAVYHDHSIYLEQALTGGGASPVCFNFAIPGGMISDDYMITRALLHDEHRPKVIVLGLTLRDFVESHVPCAASTTSFKYFKHFFDIDEIADLAMPEFWQRLDYWQSKMIYMVGQRLDLQVAFNQGLQNVCNDALGEPVTTHAALAPAELTSNIAHNLKSEAEPGDFVLHAGQIYPYEDNSAEYKKRFSHPSKKLFDVEAEFLKQLLTEAKEQGVKVLLVNMPLTPANMALMPPGYYSSYLQIVQSEAAKSNCSLLDLNNGTTFSIADFRDTAHMNASGGKKLLDAVVASIKREPSLATAMNENVFPRRPRVRNSSTESISMQKISAVPLRKDKIAGRVRSVTGGGTTKLEAAGAL